MCPQCQSIDVSRSKHRKLKDLVMALAGMKAYRCLECRERFYLPASLEKNIYRERAWLHSAQGKRSAGHKTTS
jgi:hypothetical protein